MMLKFFFLLLISGLLSLPTAAHGEGGCPPGYYPTGAPQGQAGPQGCAPIPTSGDNQSSLPPIWSDRWGAIATDGVGGHLGVAKNLLSQKAAENTAINDCLANGGSSCRIESIYMNGCAAMVLGDNGHTSNSAPTLDQATKLGMDKCNSVDHNCEVYYSACSPATQLQ